MMSYWTEIRTAYHVGRLGTVSAAADFLCIHRATVIRHIDFLETTLGAKLFIRHAKGYEPTPYGEDLIRVASKTEDDFNGLVGRARGLDKDLSGEFVVTTVDVVAPLVLPVLHAFQSQHPTLSVRFLADTKPARLEFGEADLAFRVGPKPTHPDCFINRFSTLEFGLYASKDYLSTRKMPRVPKDYRDHVYVQHEMDVEPAAISVWRRNNIPNPEIVFKSASPQCLDQAVIGGWGIGLLPLHVAEGRSDVVEVAKRNSRWSVPIWTVIHRDLHQSGKVQSFVRFLKTEGHAKNRT